MKKCVSAVVSIMIAVCCLFVNDVKANDEVLFLSVDEHGNEVLKDDQNRIHTFYTSYGEKISPREYLEFAEKMKQEQTVGAKISQRRVAPFQVVVHSAYRKNGTKVRVSSYCVGPCTITRTEQKTISDSFSISLSGSIKVKFIAEVSAKFEFTWHNSASSTTSYSLPVDAGKTGAIYFTPFIMHFNASYYDENIKRIDFTAEAPVTNEQGFADGIYEMVQS